MKKTFLPKQQLARLAEALLLFVSIAFVSTKIFSNSTDLIPPAPGRDTGENHSEYQESWHDSDDFDQGLKKRPHHYSGLETALTSLWLVPVLRYLVTANGKGTDTPGAPVIWLPVILETVADWWFHEEQLQDRLSHKGEILQGLPVPVNQLPNYGMHNKREVTSAGGRQSSGNQRVEPGRSAGILFRKDDKQTAGDGEDPAERPGHECDSHSCPACDYEPCHCIRCAGQPDTTKNKALSEPVRKPEARVWQQRPTNIVQMLAHREVTGRFPTLQAQLTSALSQSRLKREYLKGSNMIPAFPGKHRCGDYCRELACLSDTRLAVLTWAGSCVIWEQSGQEWITSVLDETWGDNLYCIYWRVVEVVAVSDSMVVLAVSRQYVGTEEKSNKLILWAASGRTWEIIGRFTFDDNSTPGHLTLVSSRLLLFCLKSELWGLARSDETGWSINPLTRNSVLGMAVLSDKDFLTFEEKPNKERYLCTWSESDNHWKPSRTCHGCEQSVGTYEIKSYINAVMGQINFQPINGYWKAYDLAIGGACETLPDGRYAELFLQSGDLVINIAHNEKMIVSDPAGYTSSRSLLLLRDGRVVEADSSGLRVRIWMEDNGEWTFVELPDSELSFCREVFKHESREISGLAELSGFRLAVIYEGGLIEIWSLMPPFGVAPVDNESKENYEACDVDEVYVPVGKYLRLSEAKLEDYDREQ